MVKDAEKPRGGQCFSKIRAPSDTARFYQATTVIGMGSQERTPPPKSRPLLPNAKQNLAVLDSRPPSTARTAPKYQLPLVSADAFRSHESTVSSHLDSTAACPTAHRTHSRSTGWLPRRVARPIETSVTPGETGPRARRCIQNFASKRFRGNATRAFGRCRLS